MQMQELTIKRREGTGKQIAKRLRREGVVPAILYGGARNEPVTVDPRAVLKMIAGHEGSTRLLTLKFDGDGGETSRDDLQDHAPAAGIQIGEDGFHGQQAPAGSGIVAG